MQDVRLTLYAWFTAHGSGILEILITYLGLDCLISYAMEHGRLD